MRILILLLLLLAGVAPAGQAAIELALQGRDPRLIGDVYLREGMAFVAIDDILQAVEMIGSWDSVQHRYSIRAAAGTAWISPGSSMLHFEGHTVSLGQRPRFIGGRLHVAEDFIQEQLPLLTGTPIYFRNLEPTVTTRVVEEDPLDRLYSFLLNKKAPPAGPFLRGVAIDAAHGGQDIGVLGPGNIREKQVTLEVAQQLERLLKMRLDIPVYLSRDKDYAVTLEQRLEAARRDDVDAWLLLHTQSAMDQRPAGVALLIRPSEQVDTDGKNDASLRLARHLETALRDAGLPVLGIYRSPLLGLGQGNLPTVLVECGFLSNPHDRQRLSSAESQEVLARALYEGLRAFAEDGRKETR